jgi:hypothetical protein
MAEDHSKPIASPPTKQKETQALHMNLGFFLSSSLQAGERPFRRRAPVGVPEGDDLFQTCKQANGPLDPKHSTAKHYIQFLFQTCKQENGPLDATATAVAADAQCVSNLQARGASNSFLEYAIFTQNKSNRLPQE